MIVSMNGQVSEFMHPDIHSVLVVVDHQDFSTTRRHYIQYHVYSMDFLNFSFALRE